MSKNLSFISVTPLLLSYGLLLQLVTPATLAQTPDQWYEQGEQSVLAASRRAYNNSPGSARNIILFIGDGMGVSTVTAARIYAGQQQGQNGEEHRLSFEQFPYTGLSKTYNTNQQTPDSAGTMSAIMTGIKTRAGVISIDDRPLKGNCKSFFDYPDAGLTTALELAEISGKATGIISTARITHATPAATYAKAADRGWESSSNLSTADKAMGCTDIAQQLIDFQSNLEVRFTQGQAHSNIDGIDLVFGGGRSMFFGEDPAQLSGFSEAEGEGNRDDGRNLITEWTESGGQYVMDQAGLNNLSVNEDGPVLGLFQASHMRYEADRHNDEQGEPSLTEMTMKAIELLQADQDGFFLMVEGGRIDHAHHANNAFNALNETLEFSRAVEAAYSLTDPNETLIIVTADHSHVMTMAGYPTRGNPILGRVIGNDAEGEALDDFARDTEGNPYTTLSYSNGSGFAQYGETTNADARPGEAALPGRHDLREIDTEQPGYHQETLVHLFGETHGGEDVAIYGSGPGAHLLTGSLEQNVIFHVMNFAGDLVNKATSALEE